MKVIIPVIDNNSRKNDIAQGFHNAEYVCIYDCSSKIYEWLLLSDISYCTGNLTVELKRKGIFLVISNHMSLMALRLFTESGLKVFKAQGGILVDNIKLLQNNQLKLYTMQSSLELSGCTSFCNSCNTSCN